MVKKVSILKKYKWNKHEVVKPKNKVFYFKEQTTQPLTIRNRSAWILVVLIKKGRVSWWEDKLYILASKKKFPVLYNYWELNYIKKKKKSQKLKPSYKGNQISILQRTTTIIIDFRCF